MDLFAILVSPFFLFFFFPPLTFVVSLLFYLSYRKKKNLAALPAIFLWFIYGMWEGYIFYGMKTVIAPIRLDLSVIVPILYTASIVGVIGHFTANQKVTTGL